MLNRFHDSHNSAPEGGDFFDLQDPDFGLHGSHLSGFATNHPLGIISESALLDIVDSSD
jgi:hypothetical protein